MSEQQFTDRELAVFFNHTLQQFQMCMNESSDKTALGIYNEMYAALYHEMFSYNGYFAKLDEPEKQKTFKTFNTIFHALPIYRNLSADEKRAFDELAGSIYTGNIHSWFQLGSKEMVSWLRLSQLTRPTQFKNALAGDSLIIQSMAAQDEEQSMTNLYHIVKAVLALYTPTVVLSIVVFSSYINQFTFGLGLISSIVAITSLAAMSAYYLINEWANGIESIIHHEGWEKPLVMLATSLVFGLAGFALYCVFPGYTMLAIALMGSDLIAMGLVLLGAAAVSSIGASVGAYLGDHLYTALASKTESIDPDQSSRFGLSESELNSLIQQQIDPIAVKCALVALRAEIANVQKNDKPVVGFFNRRFGEGRRTQPLLDLVRGLRDGTITEVTVGELHFHCRVNKELHFNQTMTTSSHSNLTPMMAF